MYTTGSWQTIRVWHHGRGEVIHKVGLFFLVNYGHIISCVYWILFFDPETASPVKSYHGAKADYHLQGSCSHNVLILCRAASVQLHAVTSCASLLYLQHYLLVRDETTSWQALHGHSLLTCCTQNPTSSGWLQSLLILRRFCTIKKRDEIKYVWLIPSSNNIWQSFMQCHFYTWPTHWVLNPRRFCSPIE